MFSDKGMATIRIEDKGGFERYDGHTQWFLHLFLVKDRVSFQSKRL